MDGWADCCGGSSANFSINPLHCGPAGLPRLLFEEEEKEESQFGRYRNLDWLTTQYMLTLYQPMTHICVMVSRQ